jgi:hypothetical protein
LGILGRRLILGILRAQLGQGKEKHGPQKNREPQRYTFQMTLHFCLDVEYFSRRLAVNKSVRRFARETWKQIVYLRAKAKSI